MKTVTCGCRLAKERATGKRKFDSVDEPWNVVGLGALTFCSEPHNEGTYSAGVSGRSRTVSTQDQRDAGADGVSEPWAALLDWCK
jgi:hypothetical protein